MQTAFNQEAVDGASGEGLAKQFEHIRVAAKSIKTRRLKGVVVRAIGTIIEAIVPNVAIGELCIIEGVQNKQSFLAEVVGLSLGKVILTPLGEMFGLPAGAAVTPTGKSTEVPVGKALLGRVVDSFGKPLDGHGPIVAEAYRSVHAAPPQPMQRALISKPLRLGVRSIDGTLTCAEGQRVGIFGEAGGGKSSLIAQIVKQADVDVVVIALIGERGREVREFVEHNLGPEGMRRAVLVVATSDKSAPERMTAASAATSMAEYFRDQGMRVLLFMDSVTRYARAQREIGLAAGEPPARRGFPPSVFSGLPKLLERPGMGAVGSITAIYTILMEGEAGSDPIAEEVRSILDGHIILSRKLASAGHYPAIDVLQSRSRVMDTVVTEQHRQAANKLRAMLARLADLEFLIEVGEYKKGVDARNDEALEKRDAMNGFLRQASGEAQSFEETVTWLKRITT
jgi:ATP synthase in type III secretion protein N